MAIFKVKQNLTQIVIQTYWEEFDTENQEEWEALKNRVEENTGDSLEDFPQDSPSDPELWYDLYKKLYYAEYQNKDDDDWISDRKGTTEYSYSLEDADGVEIVSD